MGGGLSVAAAPGALRERTGHSAGVRFSQIKRSKIGKNGYDSYQWLYKMGVKMTNIRADIFAWIPQPDVPNPLFDAAKMNATLAAALGANACGSRFGGDNFTTPPRNPAGWAELTSRARQSVEFSFSEFGAAPVIVADRGVLPGTTTVLTTDRANNRKICHSMRATVTRSPSASATWSKADRWYELAFAGAAQDPIPAAAARATSGNFGANIAAMVVPDLSWEICLRFQQGSDLSAGVRARYAFSSPFSLDSSAQNSVDPAATSPNNFAHGTITVRQFPSYVLYLTTAANDGVPAVRMAYFADASARGNALGGSASIARLAVGQTDTLRTLAW